MKIERTRIAVFAAAAAALIASAGWSASDDPFDRAAASFGNRQWRAAAEQFERFAAERPDDPRKNAAVFFVAEARQELGQFEAAEKGYHAYLKAEPKGEFSARAAFRLGEAFYLQGKTQDAQRELKRFAADHAKDPLCASALVYLGELAAARSDDQSAANETAKYFEESLRRFPKGPLAADAQYNLARLKHRSGDLAGAAKAFEKLAADWPKSALAADARKAAARLRMESLLEQAEAAYRSGEFEKAEPLYEKAAAAILDAKDPRRATISLRKAQILATRRNWSEALKAAQKIVEEHPDFAEQYEVDFLIGRCRAASADFDAARAAYAKAVASPAAKGTETAALAQWMIGESYFHQKNFEAALREYSNEGPLSEYPTWQAASLLQAAKCREHLGQPAEAAQAYERLLRDYSKTPFVDEARKRLAALAAPPANEQR